MTITDDVRARREEVVLAHMAAENEQDFAAALAPFHHPRYEIIATAQVMDGLEQVMAYFVQSRTAFPDQRNELIALRHADDAVIVELMLKGTHLGSLFGETPSNRTFAAQMAAFFLFEDDRLVCERIYTDLGSLLRQVGISVPELA